VDGKWLQLLGEDQVAGPSGVNRRIRLTRSYSFFTIIHQNRFTVTGEDLPYASEPPADRWWSGGDRDDSSVVVAFRPPSAFWL